MEELEIRKRLTSSSSSAAYIGATWFALIVGILCYPGGLYNAKMKLNGKGHYLTILFSWLGTISPILLLIIGLWNADLLLREKGFYVIAFAMSIYASLSAQKNIRD